jgi:hypothetical protein
LGLATAPANSQPTHWLTGLLRGVERARDLRRAAGALELWGLARPALVIRVMGPFLVHTAVSVLTGVEPGAQELLIGLALNGAGLFIGP